MAVLCIGELLIDFFSKENTVLGQEETYLHNAGGAPANVAATCTKLGVKSAFMGAVGTDSYGDMLEHTLQQYKIETTFLSRTSEAETTKAFVTLQADGEREFTFKRGADETYEWAVEMAKQLDDYDVYHFGSATAFLGGRLEKSYEKLYQHGLSSGKFISFDPNYRGALYEDQQSEWVKKSIVYVKQADFVKVSEEELHLLTGQDIVSGVKTLLALGAKTVAVTLGKSGVYVSNGDYSEVIPSISIEAVDATGAGDAFVGAFLYQVSKNKYTSSDLRDAEKLKAMVSFAAIAGALNCLNKGAMSALPSLEEIKAYL